MTWTATLRDTPVRENGKWKIIIRYTDGVKVIDQSYTVNNLTMNKLEKLAIEKTTELDAVDLETTTLFAGQPIDLTPPTPPTPPTQAELDAIAAQNAWFKDWSKLNQLLELQAAGLSVPNNRATQISDLVTSLNATWLNAYRNDL